MTIIDPNVVTACIRAVLNDIDNTDMVEMVRMESFFTITPQRAMQIRAIVMKPEFMAALEKISTIITKSDHA